jgi:hypothetical protein
LNETDALICGNQGHGEQRTAAQAGGEAGRAVARQRLSVAEYCREHEINYAQLMWWRRWLQRDARSPPLTLIPVVTPATSRSVIVVRLSGGVGIEVERGFDAGLLSAVVRALQAVPSC